MLRLILLNGPPAVGKSTLATRYVAEHPGTLNLDIDTISRLIGPQPGSVVSTFAAARRLGLAMAATHLDSGADVVVPQYIGKVSELERFELVAAEHGATLTHVVLMADRQEALDRFARRGAATADPWLMALHDHVREQGEGVLLSHMHDGLAHLVRSRLRSVLLASPAGDVDGTYARLTRALESDHDSSPPRAVAVVPRGGRVLVIQRRRLGIEYAVLPGGGVEPGEDARTAARRELREESGLVAGPAELLWERRDDGRQASYFLFSNAVGEPVLSGPEAEEHCPDNSFVLAWAGPDELDRIRLQPAAIRTPLRALLSDWPPGG